jgi:16S rRNA processing protein RimM
MAEPNEGIVIARIARAWGIKGEVFADILTDFPERFDDVTTVTLRRGATERPAELEGYRFHKERILLKFAGVDTMSDAELLAGFDVVVPEEELYELPEGEDLYYDFDLVGCRVETAEGDEVGEVERVMRTGAQELLVVRRPDGREALVPFVDEICPTVDVEGKRIVVDPPEGLLEL